MRWLRQDAVFFGSLRTLPIPQAPVPSRADSVLRTTVSLAECPMGAQYMPLLF